MNESLQSPVNRGSGYSHSDTYPVIARLIEQINKETKQWAKRSEVRAKLLADEAGAGLLRQAHESINKSPEWTAGNMFDFWSKDMTTGDNPYLPDFIRSRIDDETAYWTVSLGLEPQPEEAAVTETESDQLTFLKEKYLEEFLISNWSKLEIGKKYKIKLNSRDEPNQFRILNHTIDILCESFDSKELLVIELKRGRPSDVVLGQIQRYMGLVKTHIARPGQEVFGLIIAEKQDENLSYALKVSANISFNTYSVQFALISE